MKILYLSAGLSPKRSGGVPNYVAECREELIRRGYTVFYLDTNCQDSSEQPRIEPNIAESLSFSFFNTGAQLPFGGPLPAPLEDVRVSKEVESCFLSFVEKISPEIVHFHETACLPLALVSRLRKRGYRLVFTAHDYFPVCPTIQLLRDDLQVCRLKTPELQCHQCIRKWPHSQLTPASSRIEQWIARWGSGQRIAKGVLRRIGPLLDRLVVPFRYPASAYKKRRAEALEHLRSFHLLLCISKLQYEIMLDLIGSPELFRQVYLSRPTYRENPVGETAPKGGEPIRFVGLNINQTAKGLDLLLQEFTALRAEVEKAELHLFGGDGKNGDGVFFHGHYSSTVLDTILAPMDVGIIPSLWPETYGYVGPEMLSRGIPLIVSSRGAMREYVEPGVNGLWFDPSEPGSLQEKMKTLAEDPKLLLKLKSNASTNAEGIVKFSKHIDEMESIYHDLMEITSASH